MENVYENEFEDESYETTAAEAATITTITTNITIGPAVSTTEAAAGKSVGFRMPSRSNSSHSVRLLSPSSSASPTPPPQVLLPPTPPSPTGLSLSEVAVSAVSIPVVELDQQQDNQLQQSSSSSLEPPPSARKHGNSTNSTTKKAKVDFVRFDSTEIHYTDHDEVRTKISDEIKSSHHPLGEMRSSILITVVFNFTFATEDPASSCGRSLQNIQKPLIVEGIAVGSSGRWPWHASIWHRLSHATHHYVCGGTLLSELYVLTAGHCVSRDGNALNERLFTVQLGSVRQNLLLNSFPVQNKEVAEVFLHEEFSPRNFQADIAMLALRTKVAVNEFVRPICLPDAASAQVGDVRKLIGRQAVTVGFGKTETGNGADELRQLSVAVVDYVTCLESNREVFGRSLSDGVLCAGDSRGGTVCNGDSGGGLFTEELDARWVIRGITSFTAQRGWDDSSCSLKDYSGFVNVDFYQSWIRYVIRNGGQSGYFNRTSSKAVAGKSETTLEEPSKVIRVLRVAEKKCKEYRRKGLVYTGDRGSGHVYLHKNDTPLGLAYYLTDQYAITTAELAENCVDTTCETILGKRVQKVIAHPHFTGAKDFNVALLLMPVATEPVWCLSVEASSKLFFESRQLKLSSIAKDFPTWVEFELETFLPSKRGAGVYNEHWEIAGLMQNPADEPIIMTNVTAVLDWVESVVWG